jgi:nucleoside-diphosphate-sugar epimerase
MAGRIAVAGAGGLVGANVVKLALRRGYDVDGAMRNPVGPAARLMNLPNAREHLKLHAADMGVAGSFDAVVRGVNGVVIASLVPTYFAPDGTPARDLNDERGWAEIIRPTVEGCLNIMRSAIDAGVRDIVICSSTSSTNPIPPVPVKNEIDHWSDADAQCAQKKYTSAAKTVMEREAMALAAANGIRLRILLPTLMLGPALLPAHGETGVLAALKRMLKGEKGLHDTAPNDSASMAHIDDIAALFLAAYESPTAKGRYYALRESWHWNDIYKTLKQIEPTLAIPPLYQGEPAIPTQFDFTRRDSLGVKLRDIPEILADAVRWAKASE